jgi:magnesium-protoporphyrin O-methyltransferase
VSSCCDPQGHEAIFDGRFARSGAARYRRRGLTAAERQIVGFLADRGLPGATVLEIGGGIGEIQLELLKLGAAHVTNVELVDSYESEAARLLQAQGLTDRATRQRLDFALQADLVEPADIVVLHRVVCCYLDYQALLQAAAGHARRLLVFTHPPRNPATRGLVWLQNLLFRATGHTFSTYLHPPGDMLATLTGRGLTPTYRQRGLIWRVVGLERSAA